MKKTAAENRAETGAAGCHAGRRSIEQRHSPGRAQAARRGGTARTRAVYLGPAHDTCRPQAQRRPFQRRPQASARRRLCCRNKRPGDGDAERIEDGWRSAARAVDAGRAAGDVVRRLPSPAPEMLRTLAARGEAYTDADELAAALAKKPTGGHWNTGIAVLRNNSLIETDGRRYRTAALFRE